MLLALPTVYFFQWLPYFLTLNFLNGSENCRGVVGTCIANDTMLRRPDQLLLAAENDHFEGSMHLKANPIVRTLFFRSYCSMMFQDAPTLRMFSAALESLAFKVMVLRRQEELSGPSQHSIIRNTWAAF